MLYVYCVRGARSANPESITPILSNAVRPVVMDSGFALTRAPE
jgi:hypothetical protein